MDTFVSSLIERKPCQSSFQVFTIQKQRPRGFLRKGVLKTCSKFTGEHPCRSAIAIKLLSDVTEIAFR